ncbi:MAG: LacI family transcriptional regulator [Anaerolineae bacterium]|nr:LacI family transcriptional regulator [Anaerolineae bacterium]
MSVTLKRIAKECGYSVTTVSRALAGYDDVNETTRQRILEVAHNLGYQPNLVARQLQGQRTFTIGIITPPQIHHHEDDFFSLLIKGVNYAAAQYHYDLLISSRFPGTEEMDTYRRIVGGNRVDGMIVARTYQDDPRITYLQSIEHPFVVAGRSAPDLPSDFPYIDADSRVGVQMLVRHFIHYGHRHIGLILPPESVAFTAYRHAGYRYAFQDAGLTYHPEYVATGDLGEAGGYEAACTLLDRTPELTAIVACNDLMAFGAMAAVHARGRRIGEDVAVGGFDDIPAAQHAMPPLTTVRQPIYEIGERLTEMLVRIIADEPPAETQILIEPALIVRASSGQPRPQ